jgi:hypothetical protein
MLRMVVAQVRRRLGRAVIRPNDSLPYGGAAGRIVEDVTATRVG